MARNWYIKNAIFRGGGRFLSRRYPELWQLRVHYVAAFAIACAIAASAIVMFIVPVITGSSYLYIIDEFLSFEDIFYWIYFGTFGVAVYWTYRQLKLRGSFVNQPRYRAFETTVLGWLCLMVILNTLPVVAAVTLDSYFFSYHSMTLNSYYNSWEIIDEEELMITISVAGYLCFLVAIFLTIADSLGQKMAFGGLVVAIVVPFGISFIYFGIFDFYDEAGYDEADLVFLYLVAYVAFAYPTFRHSNLQRKSVLRYVAAVAFLMTTPVAFSIFSGYLSYEILGLDDNFDYYAYAVILCGPVVYLLATPLIQRLLHRFKTLPV